MSSITETEESEEEANVIFDVRDRVRAGVKSLLADPKFGEACVGPNYVVTKCTCVGFYCGICKDVCILEEMLLDWVMVVMDDRNRAEKKCITDLKVQPGKAMAYWCVGELKEPERQEVCLCLNALLSLLARIPDGGKNVKWTFEQLSTIGKELVSGGLRHRAIHRNLFYLATADKVMQLDEIAKRKDAVVKPVGIRWKEIFEERNEELVNMGLAKEGQTYAKHGRSLSAKFSVWKLNRMVVLHEGYAKFPSSAEGKFIKQINSRLRTVSDDLREFFKTWAAVLPNDGRTETSHNVVYQKSALVYQMYGDGNLKEQLQAKYSSTKSPANVRLLASLETSGPAMEEFDTLVREMVLEALRERGEEVDEESLVIHYKVSHLITTSHLPQDAHWDYPEHLRMHLIGFFPMTPTGMFLEFWPDLTKAEQASQASVVTGQTSAMKSANEAKSVKKVTNLDSAIATKGPEKEDVKEATSRKKGKSREMEEKGYDTEEGQVVFIPFGQLMVTSGYELHGGSFMAAVDGHPRGHLYIFVHSDSNLHPFPMNYYPKVKEVYVHQKELEFIAVKKKPSTGYLHAERTMETTYGSLAKSSKRSKKIVPKEKISVGHMASPSESLGRSFFGFEYTDKGVMNRPGTGVQKDRAEIRSETVKALRKEKADDDKAKKEKRTTGKK